MANLLIVEVLNEGYMAHRFRIIEKVLTLDGLRDRITNASFATLGEAEEFVKRRGESNNG